MTETVRAALKVIQAMKTTSYGGQMYIISCNGFVKIGYTNGSVQKRIDDLQNACPYDYRLIVQVPGGKQLEQVIHSLFEPYRHRGEWFNHSGEVAELISALTAPEEAESQSSVPPAADQI